MQLPEALVLHLVARAGISERPATVERPLHWGRALQGLWPGKVVRLQLAAAVLWDQTWGVDLQAKVPLLSPNTTMRIESVGLL